MVRDITRYPSSPGVEFGTDVRIFNEEIHTLIQDLKDTIIENEMEGLAAYQIKNYFNVIVVKKEDGEFLELINPRILSNSGKQIVTESTAYFAGFTAAVPRYEKISLIYQDREGTQQSLKAEGELSILLQRKIDYTFGSTFLSKLTKKEKELFENKLDSGSNAGKVDESCPTTFFRDKILKVPNIIMVFMLVLLMASLFVSDKETLSSLWVYQTYLAYATLSFIIIYFFYAQYEDKTYSSCSSCQIGNIIGTALVSLLYLCILTALSYFII